MPACVKPDAGFQATVVWHALHSDVVAICVAVLPVAMTPLWQLEQVPMTWAWSTFDAGFHALTTWQASQTFDVKMCVAFLPLAFTPLWQFAQPDVMPLWVKFAGCQAMVEWQALHSCVVGM